MRLKRARIQNYRSIRDTGWFDVEDIKTIMVGPNEAGKTAVLKALQQINAPKGVTGFEALRDYPRSLYNADIQSKRLDAEDVIVASAEFSLEKSELDLLPPGFDGALYVRTQSLANKSVHWIKGGPKLVVFDDKTKKDIERMASYFDKRSKGGGEGGEGGEGTPIEELKELISSWKIGSTIDTKKATALRGWLDSHSELVREEDATEDNRHTKLLGYTRIPSARDEAIATLNRRLPTFVYFSNYFHVKPNIHLEHFAKRIEGGLLDDDAYDYGNKCLLKLLGFTARELADLGNPPDPGTDKTAFEKYRAQKDERHIKLNAASVRLTNEIRQIWNPNPTRSEADTLRVQADGHYLRVVVEDELGVDIELDQRSAGFQWLVSFFVVFFAEASDSHANSILLLDEPGLSLHALKQRDFRETISRLAVGNQTLYTTHSPFLVGPDELDMVRVVNMETRDIGTKVNDTVASGDSAALLPLQEALGYDLAQSLFTHKRNLVLEGLTDYWYLEATGALLADADEATLNEKISLIPAHAAGKVVYFATILHANSLKVAALFDSDAAGETSATNEILVHKLGNKNIIRTADVYNGQAKRPEIEDLLRETLIAVAKDDLGWDIQTTAGKQLTRPIVDIFADEVPDFSKYRLAKAFLRWTRSHSAADLTSSEREQWANLIKTINKALK